MRTTSLVASPKRWPFVADRTDTHIQSCGNLRSSTATISNNSSFLRASSPFQTVRHLSMTEASFVADSCWPTSLPTVLLAIVTGSSITLHRRRSTSKKNSKASSCSCPLARASSARTLTCQRSMNKTLPPHTGPKASFTRAAALSSVPCRSAGINAPSDSRTAGMCKGCMSGGTSSDTVSSQPPTTETRSATLPARPRSCSRDMTEPS